MLPHKKIEPISNSPRRNISTRNTKIKPMAFQISSKIRPTNTKGGKPIRAQYFTNRAIRAAREHKIFTIHYTGPSRIRNILRSRGWIEKCSPRYLHGLQQLSDHKININARPGNDFEVIAMSRACKSISPNFVWHPSSFQTVNGMPYRNRIQRSSRFNFTSKDGLLGCIENSYWYTIDGLSEIRSPRYHRISVNDERIEFLQDYRTTYCLSLLKFICEENQPTTLFNENGSVPMTLIHFAINRVQNEITNMLNDDNALDLENDEPETNNNEDWQNYYYNIDILTNRVQKFKIININEVLNCISKCKELYNNAKLFWPTLSSDGYHNLWILKPSYWCRGNGIVIKKNYADIINFVNKRKNIRYIVQKYIERPLLIHKVKFDIRQYILLAITNSKLNIWMYKNCYLRFSSHEYSLSNLHQSIHITNNAVQKHYRNGKRSEKLPAHNMWSLDEFKYYLNEIKEKDTWDKQIYPCMKKNIMAVLLTSLEETDIIPNAFELYGADFMIDENYEPILLEINANPDMSCSTKVTGKICPQAITDLIKVVLDYPKNINANTGHFELIHSIDYTKQQPSSIVFSDMLVQGKTMTLLPPPEKKIKLNTKKKSFMNKLPINDLNIVDKIKTNLKISQLSHMKQFRNKIKKLITHNKPKINQDKNKNNISNNNSSYDENSIKIIDGNTDNHNDDSSNEEKFIIKIVNKINTYAKSEENVEKILKNIENSLLNDKKSNNSDKTDKSDKNNNNNNNNNDNNSDSNINNKLNSIRTNLDMKQIYPIFLNRSIHNYPYRNYNFHNFKQKFNKYIINKPPLQNEHEIIVSKESVMKLLRNDNNSLVPIIPLSLFNSMDFTKKLNNINGNFKVRLTSDLKEAFSLGAVEQLTS